VIDNLKVMWAPFLPFSSQQLHQNLGYSGTLFGEQQIVTHDEPGWRPHDALVYDGSTATGRWEKSALQPGQVITNPTPLYKKLGATAAEEAAIIEGERARLGTPVTP
jgi:methionyl-tRNA synthetase